MRRYILQRYSDDTASTLGLLLLDHKLLAYTLEDERRETKVKGETRIPAGTYNLYLLKQVTPLTERYRARFNWFQWHICLAEVPGFSNVYIHVGNTDRDTDGCILLGDTTNNNVQGDGFIGGSVNAYQRFYLDLAPYLYEHSAVLHIRDESFLE